MAKLLSDDEVFGTPAPQPSGLLSDEDVFAPTTAQPSPELTAGNVARNVGQRGATLAGNLGEFAGNVMSGLEVLGMNALGEDRPLASVFKDTFGTNPGLQIASPEDFAAIGKEPLFTIGDTGFGFGEVAPALAGEAVSDIGRRVENIDTGYQPQYTIDRALDDPSLANIGGAIVEQGPASLVDMAGLFYTPAPYLVSRTQEIAEDRQAADNRTGDLPSMEDYAVALPTAAVVQAIDRLALGKLLPGGGTAVTRAAQVPAAVARAVGTEAGTEALQEGIEYTATTAGTETGFNLDEALRRAAGGALLGGPIGGLFRGVSSAAELRTAIRQQMEADGADASALTDEQIDAAVQQYIDQAQAASEGAALSPEQVGPTVDQATGVNTPPPLGDDMPRAEGRQARRQYEQDLGALFDQETDVLRREDVDVTPEGLQLREGARPAQDPVGRQAQPATLATYRQAASMLDEAGVDVTPETIDTAVSYIEAGLSPVEAIRAFARAARQGDMRTPPTVREQVGAERTRQVAEQAFRMADARRRRAQAETERVNYGRQDEPTGDYRAGAARGVGDELTARMRQERAEAGAKPPRGVGETMQAPRQAVDRVAETLPGGLAGEFIPGDRPAPTAGAPRTGQTFDQDMGQPAQDRIGQSQAQERELGRLLYEASQPDSPTAADAPRLGTLLLEQQAETQRLYEQQRDEAPSPQPAAQPAPRAPGEGRTLQQGSELIQSQLEAGPVGQAGLSPEQMQTVVNEITARSTDAVTGWLDARGGTMKMDTLMDAVAVAEETGQPMRFVNIDIGNLGGLNKFYNDVSAQANEAYKGITDIIRNALAPLGPTTFMRTGGDELGVFVQGATAEQVQAAMETAQAEVLRYADELGMASIPHAKTGEANYGVQLHVAHTDVGADSTGESVYSETDRRLKQKPETTDEQAQPGPTEQPAAPEDGGAPSRAAEPAAEDGGDAGAILPERAEGEGEAGPAELQPGRDAEVGAGAREYGYRIYPLGDRWLTQSEDNRAREAAGERQVGGDTVHNTRAEAVAQAELNAKFAEQDAARARRADQEAADEAAREAALRDTDGFAETFSGVQQERVRDTLAKKVNTRQYGVQSRRDTIRKLVADGYVLTEGGLEHPVTESYFDAKALTKTGLDYAAHLLREKGAAEAEAPTKPSGPSVKFYSGIPLDAIAAKLKELFGGEAELWSRQLRENSRFLSALKDAMRGKRPAVNPVAQALRTYWLDADQRLRSIAERANMPGVARLADAFQTRAGDARATGRETFHARLNKRLNRQIDKVEAIRKFADEAGIDLTDANILRIRRMLENPGTPRNGKLGDLVRRIGDYFQEELAYQRDAGLETGEVKGYLPRVTDRAKISASPAAKAKYIAAAAKAYQVDNPRLTAEQARELGELRWNREVFGQTGGTPGFQLQSGSPGTADFQKGRTLSQKAIEQSGLLDFMVNNPFDLMLSYLQSSALRTELANTEVELSDGRTVKIGPNWSNWAEIKQDLVDQGGDIAYEFMPEIEDMVAVASGMKARQHYGRFAQAMSWARTISTMGLLELSALTSLPEPLVSAIRMSRGGSATGALSDVGNAMKSAVRYGGDAARVLLRLPRRERLQATYDLLHSLGEINANNANAMSVDRFAGGDPASRLQSTLLAAYFRGIRLEQFTNYSVAFAAENSMTFMRHLAQDLAAGGKRADNARLHLRDLNIPAAETDSFIAFINSLDGRNPTPDELSAAGRNGALYAGAINKFVGESVMRPNAATKPAYASHPLGAAVFQLQSFPFMFTKQVLGRPVRVMKAQAAELGTLDAAYATLPFLVGMASVVGLQGLLGNLRDEFSAMVTGKETPEQSALFELERALSWAGVFGKMDPILQIISGTRFQKSAFESVAGPTVGRALSGVDTALNAAFNNSPNTTSAERQLWNTTFDLLLEPLLQATMTLLPDAGVTGTLVLAGRAAGPRAIREQVGEAVAPRDKAPQPRYSLVERLTGMDKQGRGDRAQRGREKREERRGR